jgi:hypothetical protein
MASADNTIASGVSVMPQSPAAFFTHRASDRAPTIGRTHPQLGSKTKRSRCRNRENAEGGQGDTTTRSVYSVDHR